MKTIAALVLLGSMAAVAVGDELLPLKRGTRARAWAESGAMRKVDGWLRSADEATVTLDTDTGQVTMARNQITRLEYRPGGRNRLKGAAVGAAISGAAGLVLGVVAMGNASGSSCDGCGGILAMYALVFAVPGGAVGLVLGAPAQDWTPVAPSGFAVVDRAPPRRMGVALRVGIR